MSEHNLKTWPEPFQATWEGRKLYEVRVFDRHYETGDILRLFEFFPDAENFTGRYIRAQITCITRPGLYGLPPNVGVMGIKPLEPRTIDPTRARFWCLENRRWLPDSAGEKHEG